jgi:general secretion pathway protein L
MTFSHHTPENPNQLRHIVSGVLASWREELILLWHDVKEQVLPGNVIPTTLEFNDSEVIVTSFVDGISTNAGRIPLDDESAARPVSYELARLCGTQGKSGDVAIVLPQSELLRPSLRMPKASRQTLRKALAYELGRLSPLDPTQLYFDFAARRSEPPQQGLEVELRIVRRAVADRAVAICHSSQLRVASIRFGDDPREADWLSFPVDRPAFFLALWRRWSTILLAAAAALLAVAVVFAAYARIDASAEQLSDLVSEESTKAAVVERLEHEIATIRAQNEFLGRLKRAPLLVGVLADLSRVLPNNTWLNEIEASGNKIRIRGYSHSAPQLIALIDGSGRFANAQFTAPLVQDGPGNIVRFDLSFEVRR